MDHAYNLRDSYSVAQTGTNLTDYGNAVGSSYDATEDYWYAVTANAGEAPVAGFFDIWGALSTNGSSLNGMIVVELQIMLLELVQMVMVLLLSYSRILLQDMYVQDKILMTTLL